MSTILVTGGTGIIGRNLVNALRQEGATVKVASRHQPENPEGWVKFDFADPSTYADATAGVDAVFVLGPPLYPDLTALVSPFLHYLNDNKVRRVVYLSAFGMDNYEALPFHQQLEQLIASLDFDYTILRPSFFAQNPYTYEKENVLDRGIVFVPAGSGQAGFVDVRDIAEVAAKLLLSNNLPKKVYELTGPELLSYHQIAEILTEVTGKTIVYPEPDDETYRSVLASAGAPAFIADYMIPVYHLIKTGAVARLTNDVEEVLGKKPRTTKGALADAFVGV